MTAAEIAQALGGARRDGASWRCCCPAHDDDDPSLSITERDGKILFVCRAGCEQEAVLAALRQRDLWPAPTSDRPRTIATYNYRDEQGTLRYQVVRYVPKDFRQRRPNGSDGSFIWDMQGVAPLPYRLPDLLADPDATVFVAEGEKDADNLAEAGIVATCNHGGAGKWRSEISRWFAGRHVVILPDNDEPGRAHAGDVARRLSGIAVSVRLVELPGLPPKGDASDWIAAGGTIDQLDDLVDAAPIFCPDPEAETPCPPIVDAGDDDASIPPRGWLLGNTWCRGYISGLVAQGGGGKTAVRTLQALAAASGRDLENEHVFQRCRVLLVTLEDNLDELRRRVRAAMLLHHGVKADEIRAHLFLWAPIGLKLAEQLNGSRYVSPSGLEKQIRAAVTAKAIDIVVIDPLVKAHNCEENDNAAIDQVAVILVRLATELNIAVDVLQHERKSGTPEAGDANRGRGASSFRDAARLLYTVTGMTDAEREQFGLSDAERRLLIRVDSAKVNIAPPSIEARWFRIVGVPLGNCTDLYPGGDEVPTVEPWNPPDLWAEISIAATNDILDKIDAGLPDGRRYSGAAQAGEKIAAWRVVLDRRPALNKKQCQTVISTGLRTE